MKIRGKKGEPFVPVVAPKVSELYHVTWGYGKGVVGRCISVNEVNKTVIMRSPKSKIVWKNPVKWSDLMHTRKQAFKLKKSNP